MNITLNGRPVEDYKDFIKFKILFCGVFSLVGLVFTIVGICVYQNHTHKVEVCTYEVAGSVIDLEAKRSTNSDGDSTTAYYPVFRYEVGDLTYVKESNSGSSNPRYHIGESVVMLLNPNNYDEYLVKGDSSPIIFCLIFGGLGVVSLLIGVLSAIFMKFKSQEEQNEETDAFIAEHTISRDQLESELRDDGDSPFVK